jgi:hypothetical protein
MYGSSDELGKSGAMYGSMMYTARQVKGRPLWNYIVVEIICSFFLMHT